MKKSSLYAFEEFYLFTLKLNFNPRFIVYDIVRFSTIFFQLKYLFIKFPIYIINHNNIQICLYFVSLIRLIRKVI